MNFDIDEKSIKDILNLIEDNIDNIDEYSYIQFCNLLKTLYQKDKQHIRHSNNFNLNERVIYNDGNGNSYWCIIKKHLEIFRYKIKIDGNESDIIVDKSRLSNLLYPELNNFSNISLIAKIPDDHIQTVEKIKIDAKFNEFINNKCIIKEKDKINAINNLKLKNNWYFLSLYFKEQNALRFCSSYQLKALYENERNKRCRNSKTYKKIKKEYQNYLRRDIKLCFDES